MHTPTDMHRPSDTAMHRPTDRYLYMHKPTDTVMHRPTDEGMQHNCSCNRQDNIPDTQAK